MWLALLAGILWLPDSLAVTVAPGEMTTARRWVGAHVEGITPPADTTPALIVLANHDPVLKNARGGRPMKIADREFTHGLYCHAPSKLIVRLPGPGAMFTATVGVDSNEQTSGGRGSVEFSVNVGGNDQFRSGVMHEGMAGQPVKVDLAGATEFVLVVDPTPDGIACDQSDWADARVTLRDGTALWLSDLPLRDGPESSLFDTALPFSFVFDGKPSAALVKTWEVKREPPPLDAQRTERTVTWTDPKTGLQVRMVAVAYSDFPTVEWTLYFKNTGAADTPIIENIRALDVKLTCGAQGEFLLHHNVGSPADGNDYGPLETPLGPGATQRLGGAGGRPTNKDWSYANLAWGDEGMIFAVGWPGQWAAEFARDQDRGLTIRAGQELAHFKLLPGEEVRSPLIALQFWQGGDWIRAQNVWRRWMEAHSMPHPGGKLPPAQLEASSSRQLNEMIGANETNQIQFVRRYLAEDIHLDYWWMDAGWYVNYGAGWPRVGTWEVDTNRFPHGLRAVSDFAHAHGIKILVWFEPERVTAGTWLAQNHPEWVLGGTNGGLLYLGNDDARRWLTDHVDKLLTEQGIDLYRQDFNMDPLSFWRKNDAPDRQGITEIKHVTGYLAYWDELRRRHPNMLIDSCASGGRRNDLETMRRAVPLWRSDYAYEAVGHQCMTYGLSEWLPFHGTGTVATQNAPYYGSGRTPVEPYAFWSNAGQSSLGLGIDIRLPDLDYPALRRLIAGWREISPDFYGDFYPLTPWNRDHAAWIAWQFNRPEAGEGVLQVFRRDASFYESARLKLHDLEPGARYRITHISEDAPPQDFSGAELMNPGLRVNLAQQPGVAVLRYQIEKTSR
jgi:alpha-galactosidase